MQCNGPSNRWADLGSPLDPRPSILPFTTLDEVRRLLSLTHLQDGRSPLSSPPCHLQLRPHAEQTSDGGHTCSALPWCWRFAMKSIWQASCYETSFCEDQVRSQPCAMCRAFQGVTNSLKLCHVSAYFTVAPDTTTQNKLRLPDTSDEI